MKLLLACVCLLVTAGILPAQNYYMATQQARRDSAQNDAEQKRIANEAGGSAGSAGGGAAPAAAAPVDPALQATLKNVTGLQSDFAAAIVAPDGSADPSQKISLLNDLSQASQGTKPAAGTVKNLAHDLMTALAGQKKLTAPQQTKLAREIHALFNSSHLTEAQQQKLLTDVQKILTDAGTSLDDAVNVATDLKVVVTETK